MKLKTIIIAFNGITQVYDSIEEFKRKWELLSAYKELREVMDMFEKEKEKKLSDLMNEQKQISPINVPKANARIAEIAEQEIKLKNQLKFTKQEIEKSKIKGSELVNIIDFIKE